MKYRLKHIVAAGLATAAAAAALTLTLLLASDPSGQVRQMADAIRSRSGAELALQDTAHWQLWPPGLHLGRVTLVEAATHDVLLAASDARVDIAAGSLLTGHPHIAALTLDNADVFYRQRGHGDSNWSRVLAALRDDKDAAGFRITLEKGTLQPVGADGHPGNSVDIGSFTLDMEPGGQGGLLDTAFNVDMQGNGGNLALQNTLHARLRRHAPDGYSLSGAVLRTVISSTLFPGQANIDMQGDLDIADGMLTSPAITANGSYRNIAMSDAVPFRFSTPLRLDTAEGLSLHGWQLDVGTPGKAAATARADVAVAWPQREIAFTLQNGELRTAAMQATALHVVGNRTGDILSVSRLHGDIGAGSFDVPLTIDTGTRLPVLTLRPDLKNLDLSILAPVLGVDGTLGGRFSLTGGLRVSGISPRSWLESADGTLSVTAEDAGIAGTDIRKGLVQKLRGYKAFLPALADAGTAPAGGGLHITADNVFAGGGIRSTARIDMDGAHVNASGTWHGDQQGMDYTARLQLDKSLFAARKADVVLPVDCKGNPIAEQLDFLEALNADCRINDDFTHKALANTLSRRFLGK